MKNWHYCTLVFIIAAGIIFSSCTDKTVSLIGAGTTGNVQGRVRLYDTIYDSFSPTKALILNDASGVRVNIEGTSYSTMTDSEGKWHLDNIPSGIYPSIEFSKDGFAKNKKADYGYPYGGFSVFNDGTEKVDIDLFRISLISCNLVLRAFNDYSKIVPRDTIINDNGNPTYTTVFDTLFIPNGKAIISSKIFDHVPDKYGYEFCLLYFGTNSKIDPLDGTTFLYLNNGRPNYSTGVADIGIERENLIDAGFRPGQTIYCVAYCGGQFSGNIGYIDMATGMDIFSGVSPNHSEVKTFVLPP
jgi:hypothetical protein